MASFDGISFTEHVAGSPEAQLGSDSSQCVRMFDCDWEDRYQFAKSILGFTSLAFNNENPYLSRRIPHFYKFDQETTFAGPRTLFATKIVKIEGLGEPSVFSEFQSGGEPVTAFSYGSTGPVGKYPKARLHVLYQTLTYDVLTDAETTAENNPLGHGLPYPVEYTGVRYVTKLSRPSVEALTTPQGAYKRVHPAGSAVASAAYPVQWGVARVIGTDILQLTWHQIPQKNIAHKLFNPTTSNDYMNATLGKVNDNTFLGFAAGTLLLLSYDVRPIMNPFITRSFDITYTIKRFNPTGTIGHNHIWAHSPPTATPSATTTAWGWHEVTTTGATNLVAKADGVSLYDWANYNLLFTPAVPAVPAP